MLTEGEIDGLYEVSSEAVGAEPFLLNGDMVAEIRDGATFRKDDNGCIWESAFSLAGENKVRVQATVDPSHASYGFYIKDEKGDPTTGMVTYESVLDAARIDGRLVISGEIRHGGGVTKLVLRKL